MPPRLPRRTGAGSGFSRASSAGRRAWPIVLMAWERWQALPEEEKERYRARAKGAAAKGRAVLQNTRARRR